MVQTVCSVNSDFTTAPSPGSTLRQAYEAWEIHHLGLVPTHLPLP